MCALGRNVECIDDIFCVKDTKTIYLFRKALYFPCGTILAGTGHFVVNACAEDKPITCLSSQMSGAFLYGTLSCRLHGAKLKPQIY